MASTGIPKGERGSNSGTEPNGLEVRRFNGFTANLTTRELFRGDVRLDVEPKVCEMVLLLLRSPGRVVTYGEFKEAIWPDVQIELEKNVNVLASKLRETLREGDGTRYIFNKRGEGYYFNPKVTVERLKMMPPEKSLGGLSSVLPVQRQSIHRNLKWWALAGSLAVVSIAGAALWHQPEPDDFRIQGNSVIVIDPKGNELWRHAFPWPLRESVYVAPQRSLYSWLGNLKGTGGRQLVFIAQPYDNMRIGNPAFCFRANGDISWQFTPGRAVSDGGGDNMLPPYFSNSIQVIRGTTPTDTRIAISSNHYMGEANQVAFLDINGKIVGEYWHPGHLLHLGQADLDADGRNKLLLGGVNNGDHQATLVVLDPLRISGVVTRSKMRDRGFELLGMSAANERAVLLFPRSCISSGQPYTRVRGVRVTADRIVVEVAENTDDASNLGFVYELDYHLNVVNVVPMNTVMLSQAHKELEIQGKLHHRLDLERECAELKRGVVMNRAR